MTEKKNITPKEFYTQPKYPLTDDTLVDLIDNKGYKIHYVQGNLLFCYKLNVNPIYHMFPVKYDEI
jgi:hypothetical protein